MQKSTSLMYTSMEPKGSRNMTPFFYMIIKRVYVYQKRYFSFYLFFHFHYIKKRESSVAILECPEFTTP
jgi:hypothetical protein